MMRNWVAPALAALLATACGGEAKPSPTSPSDPHGGIEIPTARPAVNPLVGSWSGSAQVLTCAGPACSEWVTQPEPPGPFQLVVVEQDASFTALLDIDVRVHLTVELSGVQQPDGSVRFSGSSRPPPGLSSRTADVNAFEVRLDPESRLSGSFSYTTLWKTGSSTITGRILGAKRRLPLPTQDCDSGRGGRLSCFNGTWEGDFIIRSLDQCSDWCVWGEPGRDMRLNLRLVETDNVLSGDALVWDWLTVTGKTTRTGALLMGRGPTRPCVRPGFDGDLVCSEVLDDLLISLDRFGRMSGTLRYAREGWYGSTSGTSHYKFAVTGEIWNLVRVK